MNDVARPSEDPKDTAILRAAFECFARYGLRRTSMEDIAKGAGMSRPAIYLRFDGKEDIFRALIRQHFAQAEAAVERALAAGGPADKVILAFFHALDGEAAEFMLTSPHAAEILSGDGAFDHGEVRDAEARLVTLLAGWIAEGLRAGRLSLSGIGATAEEVAQTILAAKFGIKAASRDFPSYRAGEARLAGLLGRALTA